MWWGHDGSSLFLVLIVGSLVLRMFAGRRRPWGTRGGTRGGGPSYFAPPPSHPDGSTMDAPADTRPGFTGIPAGWMPDPSGKHDQRYWSGSQWTEHVTTGGVPGSDPPPGDLLRSGDRPPTPPGPPAPPGRG